MLRHKNFFPSGDKGVWSSFITSYFFLVLLFLSRQCQSFWQTYKTIGREKNWENLKTCNMCSLAATWPSRKCRNKLQSSIEQRPEDTEATLGDDIYQKSGFVKVSGFHLTDLSRLLFFLRCASGSASMRGPNVTSGQCFTFVCVKFGWFGLSHSCDLKCTLYNLYICTFSHVCVFGCRGNPPTNGANFQLRLHCHRIRPQPPCFSRKHLESYSTNQMYPSSRKPADKQTDIVLD